MITHDDESRPGFGNRDFLREYLAQAPVALALLRAIECRQLARLELEHPILDVGCGDGLFAQVLFERPMNGSRFTTTVGRNETRPEVGLDRSPRELRSAIRRGSYQGLVCADVAALPFGDGCFATILANGVLEHVHDLAGGLREIARVLKPGGRLIFTVPRVQEALQPGGAPPWVGPRWRWLARLHARAYNKVFGQVNMHTLRAWRELLERNGLALVHHHTYSPKDVFRLHSLMLFASLPSLLSKRLTGRWIMFPALRRAAWGALWARLLRRLYLLEDAGSGLWLLGVTQPTKDGSVLNTTP